VKLYLDSSAIVKLVQQEPESGPLRRYLRRYRTDERVTSTLARVEVVRAVLPGGAAAVSKARRQLSRLHQLALDVDVLDRAATLAPAHLVRSLDAVHLASAEVLRTDLRSVVTYDRRMTATAAEIGLPVASPGSGTGAVARV
jgi:predicted nucleic acid-binding protein